MVVMVVMVYISTIFRLAVELGIPSSLMLMVFVLVMMMIFVTMVTMHVPNWIVCLTILHTTVVFVVFTSGWFLTLVNKGTVSFSIPSSLVTMIFVLSIGSVPISWTFQRASSFMNITCTMVVAMLCL